MPQSYSLGQIYSPCVQRSVSWWSNSCLSSVLEAQSDNWKKTVYRELESFICMFFKSSSLGFFSSSALNWPLRFTILLPFLTDCGFLIYPINQLRIVKCFLWWTCPAVL